MNARFEDGVIKTPDIQYDENCGGIGNIYFNSCRRYKERVAMINGTTNEFLTYFDLLERCIRTALTLQQQGFKQQDVLAICSNRENLDSNVPIIAGQFLGMVTFSLAPSLTEAECAELIEQVQPNIIFVIEAAKECITRSLEINNAKTKMVSFGKEFEEDYLKYHESEHNFQPVFINNLYETCVVHFSSGSTGLPKPICLNHYYFLSNQSKLHYLYITHERQKTIGNKPVGQVSLRFANWYWVSASLELIIYVTIGGCRILWEKFGSKNIWNYIEKFSINHFLLTPLQCIDMSLSSKPDGVDISSVTDISTGGYALHKNYIQILNQVLPGTHVYQLYGLTECGVATTFDSANPQHIKLLVEKPNSCGLPVPGLHYKIINTATGEKCGPNQPGELYLKGKGIFNGFYNRNASEIFDDEGYFRTGDLVSFDDDFCFYIVDRIKSILGWNDFLIYPSHIEKVLLEHPSVYDAVIVGIPHIIESERLMGVVMLKKDAPGVTEDELVKYVEDRVEDHKRLREGVRFMDKFPLTVTGKVNRLKIKETILNLFEVK